MKPTDLKPGQRVRFPDGEAIMSGKVSRVRDGIAWIRLAQNAPGSLFAFGFAGDVPMEVVG